MMPLLSRVKVLCDYKMFVPSRYLYYTVKSAFRHDDWAMLLTLYDNFPGPPIPSKSISDAVFQKIHAKFSPPPERILESLGHPQTPASSYHHQSSRG
jgi:hypothetical protein